jgi:hypothetical protein
MCGHQRTDADLVFHVEMKKASEEAFLLNVFE